MLADDSLDYFERRILRLESICIHGGQGRAHSAETISNRYRQIESKFAEIQVKVPELQGVIEKLSKVAPILDVRKRSLNETSAKVNELTLQKEVILDQITSLQTIQSLQHLINKENFADADVLKERLQKIELLVQTLRPQVDAQMKEIDELIDIYEQGMMFIEKVCESWNIRLATD